MRLHPAARIPRILLPLLATLLVAVPLVGCGAVGALTPRSWGMSATNQAGTASTTSVTDASGQVLNVEFDPADADHASTVSVPAGLANTLDVAWTGGACDMATDVAIAGRGAGLAVTVKITSNGQVCDAIGLPRVIRLSLRAPVAPAAVTVSQ